MQKIKALLEQAGVKAELASKICESLETYKKTVKDQFQKEYAAKVEQAKKVCVEETEAHKRDLARRVQVWCETKGAAVEAQLAKQSAINESEAVTKLSQISAMIEGFASNGTPNGSVTMTIEKLKRQSKLAKEERAKAVELANRKTAIAEKALKRNRELTATLQALQEQKNASVQLAESRRTSSRRIDEGRSSGTPRSTRPTLVENQDRRQPVRQNQAPPSNGGFNISSIAASIDEQV